MKNTSLTTIAGALAVCMASTAWSAPAIFSEAWTEDDPTTGNLNPDGDAITLQYQVVGPFTVDASGTYNVTDARNAFVSDIYAHFYEGTFSPGNPNAGLVESIDDGGSVQLNTGQEYVLVVQPFSVDFEYEATGAWGVVLDGPGVPSSPAFELPGKYSGEFSGDEELTNIIPEFVGCPDAYHDVIPYTAPVSGLYGIGGLKGFDSLSSPVAIGVYDTQFNPDDPYDNQIGVGPDSALVFLRGGRNYWIVVQPDCQVWTRPWSIVIAQPGDSGITWNNTMTGAWSDPATGGQGMLVDTFPDSDIIFVAWFTWDTTAPDEGETSEISGPNTRWLVAQGAYEDDNDSIVDLPIYSATGGLFNTPTDVDLEPVGTLTLDMPTCEGGNASWVFDSGETGSAVMNRVAQDWMDECFFNNYQGEQAPWRPE